MGLWGAGQTGWPWGWLWRLAEALVSGCFRIEKSQGLYFFSSIMSTNPLTHLAWVWEIMRNAQGLSIGALEAEFQQRSWEGNEMCPQLDFDWRIYSSYINFHLLSLHFLCFFPSLLVMVDGFMGQMLRFSLYSYPFTCDSAGSSAREAEFICSWLCACHVTCFSQWAVSRPTSKDLACTCKAGLMFSCIYHHHENTPS